MSYGGAPAALPLQAEFREALLHAYHGPLVDFTARKLPSCFEAEERSDPAHSDVLQIVSGRCSPPPPPPLPPPARPRARALTCTHDVAPACWMQRVPETILVFPEGCCVYTSFEYCIKAYGR